MKTEEKVKKTLKDYISESKLENVGHVVESKDGILNVKGLIKPKLNGMVLFGTGESGLILQINEEISQIGIFSSNYIPVGTLVRNTNELVSVGYSKQMLGRVINFLGEAIDGGDEIEFEKKIPMEREAAGLIVREPVNSPIQTGLLSIDSTIPIGKGQRELVIGDRETGKTQICLDTILSQKNTDVISIYVSIGQKQIKTKDVMSMLEKGGVLYKSIIVTAGSMDYAMAQYMVPYAATSIAEELMHQGKDVLIIYDDLTKHAEVYRSISLILGNPPGREAYPGDVFYLHSRLLERSANLEKGGSLTALPIIETQEGDISSYIATNVIGITDGQIFTDKKLFNSGIRPAINIGLSVSRVGSSAQPQNIKEYSKGLKGDYAKYINIKKTSFAGEELSLNMQRDFDNGEILEKLFVQPDNDPLSLNAEIIMLYAYKKNKLTPETVDDFKIKIKDFEVEEKSNLTVQEIETIIQNLI